MADYPKDRALIVIGLPEGEVIVGHPVDSGTLWNVDPWAKERVQKSAGPFRLFLRDSDGAEHTVVEFGSCGAK